MSTSISFASGGTPEPPGTPGFGYNWAAVWRVQARRASSGIAGDIEVRPLAWWPTRQTSGTTRTISAVPDWVSTGGIAYDDLPEDGSWATYTLGSNTVTPWSKGVHNEPSAPNTSVAWFIWVPILDTEGSPSMLTISASKKEPLRRRGFFSRRLHSLLKGN